MSSPPKEKPRLTEQEKKNNHIASEQKRRQAIRDGFDRLATLVPGMEGQGRSESLVLHGSIDKIKAEKEIYLQLIAQAKSEGVDISDLEIPNLEPPEGADGRTGGGATANNK
jgi:heteromeric Ino2p/Ino4p transcription factor